MTLMSAMQASTNLLVQVANPAMRALVLAGAAGLGLAVFRVRDTAARLLTWKMVLCAALAMPLLGWMLPPLAIPTPEFLVVSGARLSTFGALSSAASGTPAADSGHGDLVVFKTSSEPAEQVVSGKRKLSARVAHRNWAASSASSSSSSSLSSLAVPSPVSVVELSRVAAVKSSPSVANPSFLRNWVRTHFMRWSALPWSMIAAAAYVVIALLLLTRFFIGIAFGERLLRASQALDDERLARQISFRAQVSGLAPPPQIAESEFISVPVTMGALRSTILLPTTWRDWDDAKLEAVIAHEVSHVARRDGLTQRLSLLHRAIFWFSPLTWWLDRKLADLAEQASDEAALSGGADRNAYARTLLGFFEALQSSPGRVWWQGVAMAKAGQAERQAEERLERILAWKGSVAMVMNKSLGKSAFGKAVMIAAVVLAVPVVYLAAAVRPAGFDAGPAPQHIHFQESASQPSPDQSFSEQASQDQAAQDQAAQDQSLQDQVPSPAQRPAAEAEPSAAPEAAPAAEMASPAEPGPRAEPAPAPTAIAGNRVRIYGVPAAVAPVPAVRRMPVMPAIAPHSPLIYSPAHAPIAAVAPMAPMAWQSQSYGSGHSHGGNSYHYGYDDDQRFVIVSGKSDGTAMPDTGNGAPHVDSDRLIMSGTGEDARHVEKLKKTISGDFIWFSRDEKSYVIRDQATVDRARAFWAPQEELVRKQEALGAQQEELGKKQEELGEQMEKVQVNLPDLTAALDNLRAKLQKLGSHATLEQVGDLQEEIGDLQSKMGEIQGQAGEAQGKLGEQQGKLGEQQGKLGEEQGRLGEEQGRLAEEATRKMKSLLDDAIKNGKAQPEI